MPPKPGSNIRRRLGYDRAKPPESSTDQVLKGFLKKGKLQATEVQDLSAKMVQNGDKSMLVNKCSAAGGGSQKKNMARDVMRAATKDSLKPDVYSTTCTFWDSATNSKIEDEIHTLIPYESIDNQVGDDGNIDDWCSLRPDHPLRQVKQDWMEEQGVPGDGEDVGLVGIWGDAAPFHTRDALYLVLINIISGIFHQRFWVACFPKRMTCQCGCFGRCTFASIWRLLTWVFTSWMTGDYPDIRDDGIPFADSHRPGDQKRAKWGKSKRRMKFRAAPVQKRGDWSWHKQCLNMTGWKPEGALKRLCFKCLANATTIPFTDPSQNALWRQHRLTHEVYIQLCFLSGCFVSELFNIPGFKLDFISIDLMHTGNLGIDLYLIANVIWELIHEMGATAKTMGQTLADFMMMVKTASKVLKQDDPPVNTLTPGMLKQSGKSPKARLKAAESRRFLPCLKYILERYFNQDTPHKELRYQCVKSLNDMYQGLRDAAPGHKVAKLGRQHLLLYAELGKEALRTGAHLEAGWVFWRWYPKHHLFSHCIEDQLLYSGNPIDHWCYWDESSIGDCVKVAETCHPSSLHRSIIDKHRID